MIRAGHRGFTIIEIILVLVVGLGLIVGSIGLISKTMRDESLYQTQQMFMSFTASIEPYIRGKSQGSTANNTGTFKPEVERFIREIVANTPGATFTGNYGSGPWSVDMSGVSYSFFIFPYAAMTRDFGNTAECRAFLDRLRQNMATGGMHVVAWDRCGTSDRRGAGIRYTRFHF